MVHLVHYDRAFVKIISKQKSGLWRPQTFESNVLISVEVDFKLDAYKLLRACFLFKVLWTFVLSTEQTGIEGAVLCINGNDFAAVIYLVLLIVYYKITHINMLTLNKYVLG